MNTSLRPLELTDAERFAMLANDPDIAANMTDGFPHPFPLSHAEKFISRAITYHPPRLLAILVDGILAGGIGLHIQEDVSRLNAELGYWLGKEYWHQGVMTEALKHIVAYGFSNFDLTRIYARPFGSNIGSQRALQKAAFILEAKFDKTIIKNGILEDECIYAIRRV